MNPTERITEYARTHPQEVRICWLDRRITVCSAENAVVLCADRGVSGRIIGTVAQNKHLDDMLNKLLDDE